MREPPTTFRIALAGFAGVLLVLSAAPATPADTDDAAAESAAGPVGEQAGMASLAPAAEDLTAPQTRSARPPQPPPPSASLQPALPSEPSQVVDALHAELLEVMKEADTLGYEGRFHRLEPVLKELFDIPFMAQKSVGRHWKTVGDEDRQRLLATFTRFTIANYAGRFDGYSDQHFETLKEEKSTHGTILVHSRLVSPGDDTVQLNYRLRPVDGGWRIIDVYLNGTVSELALRRSEYSSLIQREGFEALLAALDERIADLAAGNAPDRPS